MPRGETLSCLETTDVFENHPDGFSTGSDGFSFRTDGFRPGNLLLQSHADEFRSVPRGLENAPDAFECLTDGHDETKNSGGGQFKYVGETFKHVGGVFQYVGAAEKSSGSAFEAPRQPCEVLGGVFGHVLRNYQQPGESSKAVGEHWR
jgi:hypothetical protein